MRFLFGLVISVTFFSAGQSAAESATYPPRKAGLWEITVTTLPANESQKFWQCVDRSSELDTQRMAHGLAEKRCVKNTFKKEGNKYRTETDCTFSGQRMISHTVASGDFNSYYHSETVTEYIPPYRGQRKTVIKSRAHYLGPCKKDQRPGDIIYPDGRKINVNDELIKQRQSSNR